MRPEKQAEYSHTGGDATLGLQPPSKTKPMDSLYPNPWIPRYQIPRMPFTKTRLE